MNKSRLLHWFLCLTLGVVMVAGVVTSQTAINAQEQPPPATAPKLELSTKFPVLSYESGQTYSFDVTLSYTGPDRKRFDLVVTAPKDWVAVCVTSYPEKQIAALELGPSPDFPATENFSVKTAPQFGILPSPGDYKVTLEASSGALKQSLDLTAKVTAKYGFTVTTETGRLSTEATAGSENHVSMELSNTGSVPIDNITFSSTKPEGWIINFKPEKVDSLGTGMTQQVDVTINPPGGKTIAGDYMINLKAESQKISANMDLRVTVLTPTIWGWVGIIIVVVVIAGLAVLFWKLGRR